MKTIEFETTWGTISLTLNNRGEASSLNLPPLEEMLNKEFKVLSPESLKSLPSLKGSFRKDSAKSFFKWLKETIPVVEIPEGTEFQKAVWNELKNIPQGQTRTYGEIAVAIGRPNAMRAVGSACGANPLPVFIPCHRVIAKNGLGGFGSGIPWKVLLLKAEGSL